MKKLIIILTICVFGQIFGQEKTHLYLDSFDENEIPIIPKNILIGSSIDEIKKNIYKYRQKSVDIDSTNHSYTIGVKKEKGVWYSPDFSSFSTNRTHIEELFVSNVYILEYSKPKQYVSYVYNEQNDLLSISNKYELIHKEKSYDFSTETRVDYSISGKKLVLSKAFLFNEFEAGKWQVFNNKGKIINELNFDKKFKLTFIDVFNILKDFFYFLNLDNDEITLERSFNEKEAYWVCRMHTYCFKGIVINDKTGELIYENDPNILKKYIFRDYENRLIEDFLNNFY